MKFWITVLGVLLFQGLYGQANILQRSMSIDRGGNEPDASAILDLRSTKQGFLVPRMNTSQRNSISSPATGLLVYDTDNQAFYYSTSSGWVAIEDLSSTNELQTLTLIGNALSISSGNTVNLPSGSSLWQDGVGSSIHYSSGTVSIGANENTGNKLYIEHSSTEEAVDIQNNYSGSENKVGLNVQLSTNGTGSKTGIRATALGGSSESCTGISSYIIAGNQPNGTYRSISTSISGVGTALYSRAFENSGKAGIFDGDVQFLHSGRTNNQLLITP